jgi:hypothetical protein
VRHEHHVEPRLFIPVTVNSIAPPPGVDLHQIRSCRSVTRQPVDVIIPPTGCRWCCRAAVFQTERLERRIRPGLTERIRTYAAVGATVGRDGTAVIAGYPRPTAARSKTMVTQRIRSSNATSDQAPWCGNTWIRPPDRGTTPCRLLLTHPRIGPPRSRPPRRLYRRIGAQGWSDAPSSRRYGTRGTFVHRIYRICW